MITSPEESSVLGIKAILHDKKLATNALIYIFIWNMNALAFAGCDIALGNLSVDLRYAMLFLGVVQSVCSIIAGFLIIKFKPEIIFKYTSVWMAVLLSIFIFEPKSVIYIISLIHLLYIIIDFKIKILIKKKTTSNNFFKKKKLNFIFKLFSKNSFRLKYQFRLKYFFFFINF